MEHRKFLSEKHKFQSLTDAFDGKPEFGKAPPPLLGGQLLTKLNKVQCKFEKPINFTNKRKNVRREKTKEVVDGATGFWKKKFIFLA